MWNLRFLIAVCGQFMHQWINSLAPALQGTIILKVLFSSSKDIFVIDSIIFQPNVA